MAEAGGQACAKPLQDRYYIGIGHSAKDGINNYIQSAKKSALEDIISEIKVTISSSSVLTQIGVNKWFQERYEQIAVGTAVTVDLDARVGKPLTGKVVARVPVNDPDARTFLVRVSVTAGSSVMTPGMSARVVFPLHGGAKMVKVPRDAIVRKPDGSATVWIINDGDTLGILK